MTFRDWIVVALSSRLDRVGNGYTIQFATDLALQACIAWGHDVVTGEHNPVAKCQRCGVLVVVGDEKAGAK